MVNLFGTLQQDKIAGLEVIGKICIKAVKIVERHNAVIILIGSGFQCRSGVAAYEKNSVNGAGGLPYH